jgi:hypothetical protein
MQRHIEVKDEAGRESDLAKAGHLRLHLRQRGQVIKYGQCLVRGAVDGRPSSEAGDGGCRSFVPYRNPSRQDRCDRGDDARDRTATGCVERIGAAAMDRGRWANQLWAEPARDDRVPMGGQRLASLSPDRQTGGENTISRRLRGFPSLDDQSAARAESIGVLAQRWRESGRSWPTPCATAMRK